MRLYLFRHGIAVPHGSTDFADDDRPLTPKGERRVRQVSYGWKALDLSLDRIVTSPLPRALRTAEILARVLGDPDLLETSDALKADQDAGSIAAWLKTRPEENLMLVGHNPHLSDLIGLLATGTAVSFCELRRAGMAALSTEGERMRIDWIARPRIMRRLKDR